MGTNERREREKGLRREAIVDSARTLFFEKGFRDTTIDDIARSTELARGTIYLYFENKEEIFAAIMEEGLAILHRLIRDSYNPSNDALTNLLAGHDAYMAFHDNFPEYYATLPMDKAQIMAMLSDEIKNSLDEKYILMVKWIARVLTEGIEQGFFRPMPVMEVAVMQMGIAMGYAAMMDKCGSSGAFPIDRSRSREVLHDLIANGVVGRTKAGA